MQSRGFVQEEQRERQRDQQSDAAHHTRDLRRMGRLWEKAPRMGGLTLFFALASLGLPGLGNFIAEFLVLLGSFREAPVITCVATAGLVGSTVYALWLVFEVFQGEPREPWKLEDLTLKEVGVMLPLVAALLWLGLYPQPVLDTSGPVVERLQVEVAP